MDHDPHQPHRHQPQSAAHPPPSGMMVHSGNSYHHHQHHHHHPQPNLGAQMMNPNSSALLQNSGFPFNSVVSTPASKLLEPLNSGYSGDGSSGLRPNTGDDDGTAGGFSIDPARKKRGRPRKYSPDGGNIALALAPTPTSTSMVQLDSSETPSPEGPSKKHRGRPPGSGKKQLDALGNCGVGFTPHVILVKAGEDIASKIMAFSQEGPRTVCILSANGSISNVTLRQSTTAGGSVTYEGRFEIISLSGSLLVGEREQVRTGGMSISLAGPDGRVVGGGVAGVVVAASPVQIIVGSFIANGKKPKYMPSVPESRMLHFVGGGGSSPPSQDQDQEEGSTKESSEANAHLNHSSAQPATHMQQQHQQQQQMYAGGMGWPNRGNAKMLYH